MKRSIRQKMLFKTAWKYSLTLEGAAKKAGVTDHTLQIWFADDAFRSEARKFRRSMRARSYLRNALVASRAIDQRERLLDHPEELKNSFQCDFLARNSQDGNGAATAKSPRRPNATARRTEAPKFPIPTSPEGKRRFGWLVRNEKGDYRKDGDDAAGPAIQQRQ